MEMNEGRAGACEVSREEAAEELARLLADQKFHATERAKRILTYIAERFFEGEENGVKAYAIAVDVLNRSHSFDTNADPIVRIEVSRLRSALSTYYETYGPHLGICMHLPVGRYVTVFTRSVVVSNPSEEEIEEERTYLERPDDAGFAASIPVPSREALAPMMRAAAVVAALAAAGTATASLFAGGPPMTVRPQVWIEVSAANDVDGSEAADLSRYLVTALSRFRTLELVAHPERSTAHDARVYKVDLNYYSAGGSDRRAWWQVIDGGNASVLKAGLETVPLDGRDDPTIRSELASAIARRLAASRGVIGNIEAHDDALEGALGNACVLRGEYALDEGGRESIKKALPCLERTLLREPSNADTMAILSRVIVAMEGADPATTDFTRATTLANRAVSIDPDSDRAYVALMMAQFYTGRTESAIASGNKALSLNPDNPDVLAKFAGVLYSAGYGTAAVSMAKDASKNVEAVPRDARIVIALDAYGRSDWADASLASEQINCTDFVVRAIRAASLGEMGSEDAYRSLEYLRDMMPDYETALPIKMERRRYPAPIISALQAGLEKAKLKGQAALHARE